MTSIGVRWRKAAPAAELPARFPADEPAIATLWEIPAYAACVMARASANLTLVHFPGADPDLDRDLTRHLTSGFCGVQLTTAVAPDIKSGDHLPEAALRPLPKARDRASEISADVLALPGNRSVSGFTSLTLGRIGLAP